MGKNIVAAAIDLSDDFSQVSIYDGKNIEPQSVSTIYNDKRYLIPSVIWINDVNGQMFFGDEAVRRNEKGNGVKVSRLVTSFDNEEKVEVGEKEYTSEELLSKYIEFLIEIIRANGKNSVPQYIAVTLENPADSRMMELVFEVMKRNRINKQNVSIQTHTESFMYYVVSQSNDIWAKDVALFDFNEYYFKYRRMYVDRTKTQNVVRCEETELTYKIPYECLDEENGKAIADETLASFVQGQFGSHNVSAAFLTGSGFYKEWAEKTMPIICNRRRVFKGYNLFVKGACYAAMEKAGRIKYDNVYIMSSQRTGYSVALLAGETDKEKPITLSHEGVNWYEAGAYTECILDDVEMIKFQVDSVADGTRKIYGISLEDFPERPPRTTRVGVRVKYLKPQECTISIIDKGFGDLFKSSGIVIEEKIISE